MKYFFLTFLFVVISVESFAGYKYVIYTDQASQAKAREIIAYFNNTPPLNQYEFDFTIVNQSRDFLDCKSSSLSERQIACNEDDVARAASRAGFDQAFIVTEAVRGGTGGGIPIMGTEADGQEWRNGVLVPAPVDNAPSIMLHEYMHTLGFGDEYSYTADEASEFCTRRVMGNYLNVAIIRPRSSYNGDEDARRRHSDEIPWYSSINSGTPIATNSLGTPSSYASQRGLFPSITCQNSSNNFRTWKPTIAENIMGPYGGPIGPMADLLDQAIISLGVQRKSTATSLAVATPPEQRATDTSVPPIRSVAISDNLLGSSLEIDTTQNIDPMVEVAPIETVTPIVEVTPILAVKPTAVISLGETGPLEVSEEINIEDLLAETLDSSEIETINSDSSEEELASTQEVQAEIQTHEASHTPTEVTPAPEQQASPDCRAKMNDFFEDPDNAELKEEYMKLQGKITLHRVAWTFLKQANSPTDTIENTIQEMIMRRDPELYQQFINSGTKTRNERLGFAISELKRASQELATEEEDQTYALQYSDVKMINLLVNAEELNGRTLDNGVMDFTSIISNSLKNRFDKKEQNLDKFKTIIDQLTAQKSEFESRLLTHLRSVKCDLIRNNDTCEVQSMTGAHLSQILENTENIIDFVYQDDFGRQSELKDIYQWRNYWLHVGR